MKKVAIIGSIVLGVVLCGAVIMAVFGGVKPLSWGHDAYQHAAFSDVAIMGYDAVSFHNDKRAKEGTAELTHEWKGLVWQFTSESNKALFAADPEKYAPQYGGYCSFAVSKGFTADPNPKSFVIKDDKLYLFHDEETKAEWSANKDGAQQASESNWN